MLTLTYAPGTVSIAVAIALEEAGVAYEARKVRFAEAEQTQAPYLAINPKGRVPALITDRGTLTETGAILDYIAATNPEADLVPADPFQAAKMHETMYYIASTLHVNHAHRPRGQRWARSDAAQSDMAAMVPQTMTDCADHLETHILRDGPFVCGSQFSLADPYLYVVSRWFPGDEVDLAPYPAIRGFMAEMETRASVQAVLAKGMLRP